MPSKHISRRDFLRIAALGLGSLVVAACAPKATPTPEPAAAVTKAPTATKAAEPTKAPAVAAEVPREKTLIIGFEEGPMADAEQANILVPGSRKNYGYHQCVIEALYYLNYQTGESIPWLAAGPEKWNEDYTECTIPIREGVEWADGVPFTADDVVYTIKLVSENPTMSDGATMAKWVKECDAPDPMTVRIALTESNPRFIYDNFAIRIWGGFCVVPKHIWETQDPMTFRNFDLSKGWPIFTGPYKLVKASPTEFIFDRRDDWWGAKTGFHPLPAPERIVFIEAGDDDKKAAMLEADQVDGQPSLSLEPFFKVREKNPNAIGWLEDAPYTWIDPCPSAIVFQCETPPWDDPEMRWAVAYALDNEKIAKTMGGGYGIPARFQFPLYGAIDALLDENNDLFEKWDMRIFDPTRSKQIIESKGYTMGKDGIYQKDGEKLKVDVLGVAPGIEEIMYCGYLKQVGMDAEPKLVSTAVYHDSVAHSQFELDAGWSYCGSVVDPYASFNTLHSRWIKPIGERHSHNEGNWRNEEFDKATEAIGMLAPDDPRIKPFFRTGLEIWLRELPVMAVVQQLRVVPYSTRYWTNWPTAKNDYFHPPNWWMCFLMVIMKIKPA